MLNNLNLKLKLFLALLIPVVGLIYFSVQTAITDLTQQQELKNLHNFLKSTTNVSNLIHELQKERGASTGYIGSKSMKFKTTLLYQRKLTDIKIDELKEYNKNTTYQSNFSIDELIHRLDNLQEIRRDIDAQILSFEDTLAYYTNTNKFMLDFISRISIISKNDKMSQMGAAYVNLLRAKEYSGIERAILSNVFSLEYISAETFKYFNILYTSHKTFLNNYKSLINKKQLDNFKEKMMDDSVDEVNEMRQVVFSKVEKSRILSDIKELAGYGGLIHNFKNYLLRGDMKYVEKFEQQYKAIILLIKEYQSSKTLTNEENILLNIIHNTFEQYYVNLQTIRKIPHNLEMINILDSSVAINDTPAINAINTLSNNILGSNATYWFNISTKRINILKIIENDFIVDITSQMDILLKNIENKTLINLMIILFIIISIFILSIKIIFNITNSLAKFQDGLTTFFIYLTNHNHKIEPIVIDTNDEFSQMADIVNENINKTKIYLDKQVENELKKTKEKDTLLFQQSKMASMGEMIGNIAHQWRQPLSVISTASTGMQLQKEMNILDDESFIKLTKSIDGATAYLTQTIEDFRDFFKSDKDEVKFFIQDAINKDLSIMENAYKIDNINIVQSIDKIELSTFKNELSQAVLNILKNAKDVLVEKVTSKRLILIDAKKKGKSLVLTIQDNAGGIPEDIIDKIFEPYFTTKHQSQGTGIGLYMTMEIIVQHLGGTLTVSNESFIYEDEEYFGANFVITLPLKV